MEQPESADQAEPLSVRSAPAAAALVARLAAPAGDQLPPLPRTMVVAAHPDDETVAAGSRLSRLAEAQFVYVTDGAPRDGQDASRHGYTPAQYAQARRRELESALAQCGIRAAQVLGLGCPDQQAALQLAQIATRLAELFAQGQIEAVLTQPYEGGHPDHDASAFAVHAAAALMRAHGETPPDIVEMALYNQTAEGIRACAFLPGSEDEGAVVQLTREEQQHKAALVACFTTQRETLRRLPPEVERFRPAPRYDFTQRPHEGQLHYEQHPWGMSGERFATLAAQALAQLQLEGPL